MGAIKVLSEEELLQAAKLPQKKTKEIDWRGLRITIKETLSLQEYLNLVQRIMRESSDEEGHIVYEAVDFAMRVNIIASYAFIDLPKDAQRLYDVIYGTDLFVSILQAVNCVQIRNLTESIALYTGIRGEWYESCR